MTDLDLRNQYKEETGNTWFNGDGEPDIEYLYWLESKLTSIADIGEMRKRLEKTLEKPSYVAFRNNGYVLSGKTVCGSLAHTQSFLWEGIYIGLSNVCKMLGNGVTNDEKKRTEQHRGPL